MIRKTMYILSVLIVSISLLAHTVMPHHHHKGMPCFTVRQCQSVSENTACCSHGQEETEHLSCCSYGHNQDQPEKGENSCVLDQLVIVTANNQDHNIRFASDENNSPEHFAQLSLFTIITYYLTPPEQDISFRQTPYLINYHEAFASLRICLRAPPVNVA